MTISNCEFILFWEGAVGVALFFWAHALLPQFVKLRCNKILNKYDMLVSIIVPLWKTAENFCDSYKQYNTIKKEQFDVKC